VHGNSTDKLRHPRYVAYSVELFLLNKHQISGGGACLPCYPVHSIQGGPKIGVMCPLPILTNSAKTTPLNTIAVDFNEKIGTDYIALKVHDSTANCFPRNHLIKT